jgi:hypothetical protein
MKALITLLILGTSSVALARPITINDRDDVITNDNITVRDHRDDQFATDRPYYRADSEHPSYGPDYNRPLRFRLRPVVLANDVSFMRQRNRDQRPLLIDIDSRTGTFKTLRLDRQDGRAFIDNVVVVLANGRTMSFDVNQTLSARSPSITIDVNHRAITGIYVYGTTERGRASFDVVGMRR